MIEYKETVQVMFSEEVHLGCGKTKLLYFLNEQFLIW